MNGDAVIYYENYSPVGDILVIATCLVFIILISSAYISKTKNFMLFRIMIGLLMLSGTMSIFYHFNTAFDAGQECISLYHIHLADLP